MPAELPPDAVWALPASPHDAAGRRLRVLAYDVGCPRRWRRLRRALARWCGAGQLSVAELHMGRFDFVQLLSEAHALLAPAEDRLASWQPADGKRLDLQDLPTQRDWPAVGHWVFCYDIRDPRRLVRLQRLLARHTSALQRSVYWLRGGAAEAYALTRSAASLLDGAEDRLSLYPLQQAGHLATYLGHDLPVLPVSDAPWWTPDSRRMREAA